MFLMKLWIPFFLNQYILIVKSYEYREIQETDTITFQCPRSPMRLYVERQSGQREWLAEFTQDDCATFKNMKCSQNTTFNILKIPVSSDSRGIVSYSCGNNVTYGVTFYALPENISCGMPELDYLGESISVICSTSKIFPQAVCHFYDTYNRSTNELDGEVQYTSVKSFGPAEYYSVECTLKVKVTDLLKGNHQFYLIMEPMNVTITSNEYIIKPDILLSTAKPQLDKECLQGPNVVQGYIKAGTPGTCRCSKEEGVNTTSRVYWANGTTSNDIIVSDETSANLTVTFPNDHNKVLYCKTTPMIDEPNEIIVKPIFAFGPGELQLSKSKIKLEVCSNVSLTCSLSNDDVSPGVIFEWILENQDAIVVHLNNASSILSSRVTLTALLPGKYIVTCRARNSIFPDIFSEIDTVIFIESSVNVEPKIKISKGIFVKELATFEEVNITCSTNVMTDLTLSCFNKTVSGVATSLTIAHNFTKEDNGQICNCTSVYNCYERKTIQKPVYLAYGPRRLNISSEYLKLDMCTDGTVAFSVPENEVYPTPYFNISTNDPNSLVLKTDSSDYNGTVAVQAQKAGEFNLTIEALNAYDDNIRIQTIIKVIVSDSLLKKPVLSINKGQIVQEGKTSQNVSITCKSSEYNVSLIQLSCLGTIVSSNGTDVAIYANLTRLNNIETCSCQVQYNSTCNYVGQTSVPINVTYEATIYNFTANHLTTVEVSEGDNVTLKCYADSNPKPFISVQSEGGHHLLPINYFSSNATLIHPNVWETLVEIQDIKCKQSSVYYCVAGNQLFSHQTNRTVTIYVRCDVQLLNPSNSVNEIKGKINGVGAASIELIGYPEPQSILLFRSSENESIDNRYYTYTYKRISVQYGTLKIFIDQLQEENFTTYVVNVSNGQGPNLSFQFSIVKDTEPLALSDIIIICTATAGTILILLIIIVLVVRCLKKRKDSKSKDPPINANKDAQKKVINNNKPRNLYEKDKIGPQEESLIPKDHYDDIDENNAMDDSEPINNPDDILLPEREKKPKNKKRSVENGKKSGSSTSRQQSGKKDPALKTPKREKNMSNINNSNERREISDANTNEHQAESTSLLPSGPDLFYANAYFTSPKGEQEQEGSMDTEINQVSNFTTDAPKVASDGIEDNSMNAINPSNVSNGTEVEVNIHTDSNQSNVPSDNGIEDNSMNVNNPSKESYITETENEDQTIPKEPIPDKNKPPNRYTPMTVDQNQVSISINTV